MKKKPQHTQHVQHTLVANRIKPAEGVCIVLLSLGAMLVFLWALFIAVRLVIG